jgi:hypothetical protein
MNVFRLLPVLVLVAWVAVEIPDVAGPAAGDRYDQHNPCNPKIRKC